MTRGRSFRRLRSGRQADGLTSFECGAPVPPGSEERRMASQSKAGFQTRLNQVAGTGLRVCRTSVCGLPPPYSIPERTYTCEIT
jgi:hypothetical protein